MNLLDRLKLLAKSTVNGAVRDLFHEDAGQQAGEPRSTAGTPAPKGDVANLLAQAEKRLATLRDDLAAAVAREKRAETAWSDTGALSRTLNGQVDELLRADKREDAAARLSQAKAAEKRAADLERELQRFAALSARLKQEIADLEGQLGAVRNRINSADEREASVTVQEREQTEAKTGRAAVAQAADQTAAHEESTARREDQADAKDELDNSRMADLIKKAREKK